MNRIIIIGNGFDKAHDLPTGYTDFINHGWKEFASKVFSGEKLEPYEEKQGDSVYARFEIERQSCSHEFPLPEFSDVSTPITTYQELLSIIDAYNEKQKEFCNKYRDSMSNRMNRKCIANHKCGVCFKLVATNSFLGRISDSCMENWVDVESEYYDTLKKLLSEEDTTKRNEQVKKLNEEFGTVKKLLEAYLNHVAENTKIEKHQSIHNAFFSLINLKEIANRKQKAFFDSILESIIRFDGVNDLLADKETDPEYSICLTKEEENKHYILKRLENIAFKKQHCTPHTIILNFNYTKTAEKLYTESDYEVINIHGELKNKENPIIFGYGDELDDDYKKIEKLQDNDFLENIKSINYHKTRNYRKLLSIIESDPYQVFVMGHSCGNSDRTLLNTLFEHENCISVKVFYQQFEDGSDDYSNLIRNISRNFNDKPRMRDVVVNWEDCSPLIPVASK